MNDPLAAEIVESYLDEVAAGLHGLRQQRKHILAELRDGLSEAINDRYVDGLPPTQVAAAAVASFGDPQRVAGSFGGELATGYARRTVMGYVVTGPLVGVWWLLLFDPEPWRGGPGAFIAAIPGLPTVALAIATAAGVVATTGRLVRWLPEAAPRRALTATTGVAALAAIGDLLMIAFYLRFGIRAEPVAVVAMASSLLRIGCGVHVTRRCHRLSRNSPGSLKVGSPIS